MKVLISFCIFHIISAAVADTHNKTYSAFYDTDAASAVASPIILNLDDNLSNDTILLDDSGTYFDIKNRGFRNRTGWVSATDGLLAWDENNNGKIDAQNELFGDSAEFVNGFDKLRNHFDSDNDSRITNNDTNFDNLLIWIDKNSNGISEKNELFSLNDLGISSIDLKYTRLNGTGNSTGIGNSIAYSTFKRMNGKTGHINDYLFKYGNCDAKYDKVFISDEIKGIISNFNGCGVIKDLHVAMAEDKDLLNFVKHNMQTVADINKNFDTFMMKWSGLEKKHKKLGINTNGKMRFVDMIWILSHRSGYTERTDAELISGNLSANFPVERNEAIFRDIKQRYLQVSNIVINFNGVVYSEKHDRVVISDAKKFIISILAKLNTTEFLLLAGSRQHFNNLKSSGAHDLLQHLNINIDKTNLYYGTEGRDAIVMPNSKNLIIGSKGNDIIQGGTDNDSYIFNRGDGQDRISDAGGIDTVHFGTGISKNDLVVRYLDDNLIITLKKRGKPTKQVPDKIIISNSNTSRIESFGFADGTVSTMQELEKSAKVR